MVEPEMAFADLQADMDLAEIFLKTLLSNLLETCPEELDFFNKRIEKGIIDKLERLSHSQFQRVGYTEALEILTKSGRKFEFPLSWGCDLQSEHERFLTEKAFGAPVIVTDYPKDIKAFYMKVNQDGKTVRAMDVLLPQVGEIIGGAQREDAIDTLQRRMRETGLNPLQFSWYADLREFGSVPHAGFGLGFERLVQFCTGMTNIRDVIPFPRTPGSLGL
jgi:asparaginyl-tRNA synthetase